MPAVVAGPPEKKDEAMWAALKIHVMRERQKKKQEQEADAEVERQRKERERQQKQDVMTLGETREQIQQLENRLAQLKDEKHQLFLQLKKVLNEDDNRRKQITKDHSEVIMQQYPAAIALNQSLYLPQSITIGNRSLYKVANAHGAQHTLIPPGALKRTRSPSPPLPNYHQGYGYKPTTIGAYSQQKIDDGRRGHEYGRAVLWNKGTQYANLQPYYAHHGPSATTVSFSPSVAQTVYTYAAPQYGQPPPAAPAPPREETAKPSQPHTIYIGQPRSNLSSLPPHNQSECPPQKLGKLGLLGEIRPHWECQEERPAYVSPIPQPMEHTIQKQTFQSAQEAEKYYTVAASRPATHVPIHGGAIPIQQPPQGAKTGSITSGYPIRAQPVSAPPHPTTGSYQPAASTPHSVYVSTTQSGRVLFTQPGPPGHPPQGRYTISGMPREG